MTISHPLRSRRLLLSAALALGLVACGKPAAPPAADSAPTADSSGPVAAAGALNESAPAAATAPTDASGRTTASAPAAAAALEKIKTWVHGRYNNSDQVAADLANKTPDNMAHRPMYQVFAPVEVPGIDGYLVYQQSSMDGSDNPATVFRAGLIQFLIDEQNDVLIERELNFRDIPRWVNGHLEPGKLAALTMDDVKVDTGCDFVLKSSADGSNVSGPMGVRTCKVFNPGTQSSMYAVDEVVITADSFSFKGVFVNEDGVVVWGNESGELNKLQRKAPL